MGKGPEPHSLVVDADGFDLVAVLLQTLDDFLPVLRSQRLDLIPKGDQRLTGHQLEEVFARGDERHGLDSHGNSFR